MRNPYIAGAPLRGKAGFFGRQDTLAWVARELNNAATNALVLFGQRRIGKTSLLLQLQTSLPAAEFLPVYFDLQDQATRPLGQVLADLQDTTAERAGLGLARPAAVDDRGTAFRRGFLPELYQHLGEARRVVFLFDEFDVLDQLAQGELPETAAARAFFPFLRRLMTDDARPAFVFVVGRRAEDLALDVTATFKASLVREIWTLDTESAAALVRQAEANGSLSFSAAAVARILALTNAHPYLTQLLCQRLWERAHAGTPAAAPGVDVPEVEAAVADALEAGNQAMAWLWDGLSPAEKIYAAALAEASVEGRVIREDRVIQVLTEHATRLRTREVELAPSDLVKRRVLEAAGGRDYRFAVELFRRWVTAQKPLREVKDELDQVVPLAEQLFGFGLGFFKRSQWESAARYFRDSLQANPRHFRSRLHLGECLLELGRGDEAVAELERAYALDRDEARLPLARALIEQARARDRAGDDENALQSAERALQVSPNEAAARELRTAIWTRRGDALVVQDQLDQALGAYQQAGQAEKATQVESWLKRKVLNVLEQRAQSLAEDEDWSAAAAQYQQLIAQSADEESLARWRTALQRLNEERELARLFEEAVTAMEARSWNQAKKLLEDVLARRPDYRRGGQTAARLLQRVTAELTRRTTLQRVPAWGWLLVGVFLIGALVVVWQVAPTFIQLAQGPTATTPPAVTTGPLTPSTPTGAVPEQSATPTAPPTKTPQPRPLIESANVEQLELQERLGRGTVAQALYSPDGTVIAAAATIGVYLYDAQSLELLSMTETGFPVESLVFTPDGRYLLAASSQSREIVRWEVTKGTLALSGTLTGHSGGVLHLAVEGDGTLLASASYDQTIRIWNVAGSAEAQALPVTGAVSSLAFTPDGSVLAAGFDDGRVQLWNTATRLPVGETVSDHADAVSALAIDPLGLVVASGGGDGRIVLRSLSTGEALAQLEAGDRQPVEVLAFAPDGARLAAGTAAALEMYQIAVAEDKVDGPHFLWSVPSELVLSAAFTPDSAQILAVAKDARLRRWRAVDATLLEPAVDFTPIIEGLAVSANGAQAGTWHADGSLRVWSLTEGRLASTLNQDQLFETAGSLAFSPDGATLAAGYDQAVRLWRLADGAALPSLTGGHADLVSALAYSPDGRRLASASEDGIVQVWDMTLAEPVVLARADLSSPVTALVFDPDSAQLAAGLRDGQVLLWRLDDWSAGPLQLEGERRGGNDSAIRSLRFTPEGGTVWGLSVSGELWHWDTGSGRALSTGALAGFEDTVLGAAFTPAGTLAATGSYDGHIMLWDADGGALRADLTGHSGSANALAFTPDGTHLISGADDGTLRVWAAAALP